MHPAGFDPAIPAKKRLQTVPSPDRQQELQLANVNAQLSHVLGVVAVVHVDQV
jgi:hypothetical protein